MRARPTILTIGDYKETPKFSSIQDLGLTRIGLAGAFSRYPCFGTAKTRVLNF
jgi:hypothetical protein